MPMGTRHCAVLFAAVAGIAFAPHVGAAPRQVQCPTEIQPSSIQVANTPGWRPLVQSPLYLASAGMSAGPPESLAILRGEQLNKKGQPAAIRYEFGAIELQYGKWLNCAYGEDAAVTLTKRLDDSVKECTVSYLKQKTPGRQEIKITCT
jgi:hypothetical protein